MNYALKKADWANCLVNFFLLLHLECHSVEFHLLYHSQESVGTGWGEVFGESDIGDEMKVGIEDGIGSLVVEGANEKGYESLDNEGIALCLEVDGALRSKVCLKPYTTLTSVDEV